MTTLEIGINPHPDDVDAESYAVADVLPIGEGVAKRGVVVPVGGANETEGVSVEAGRYLVQAVLPSGSILSGEVEVKAGGTAPLILESERSRREHQGWHDQRAPMGLESTRAKSAAISCAEVLVREGNSPWQWSALAETTRKAYVRPGDLTRSMDAATTKIEHSNATTTHVSFRLESVPGWPDGVFPRALPTRAFALFERGAGTDLVSLPLPWHLSSRRADRAQLELSVPEDPSQPIRSTIGDPHFGSMLAYLANGALPTAARFVPQDASLMLFRKVMNPYAAAAGAYVLLATETDREPKPWHKWVLNLDRWFPWLPDGAVLAGWHQLRRGDAAGVREARGHFEEAVHRGLPCYSPVLRLLLDGLTMLVDDPDSDEGDIIRDALPSIRRVVRGVNMREPFTTLRIGPTR